MVPHSLPSPPAEDQKSSTTKKNGTKSVKPQHRTAKRAGSGAAAAHHHDHINQSTGMDSRHKRVWKACERCRMKKTKCDGEFPCKRCKDDGLVCTAGVRKKVEFKQLPRGYAEVLENSQFALVATIHKLYSMVRNSQSWDIGEPELNDRGQPVVHNIAQKLGCIRPNNDVDLPAHTGFPEDEASMADLARQLEEQQQHDEPAKDGDRASSSDPDHSDFEQDYRSAAFGDASSGGNSSITMSPQSFSANNEFDYAPAPADLTSDGLFPETNMSLSDYGSWGMPPKNMLNNSTMQFMQQVGDMSGMGTLNQGLAESDFGTIKPNALSCSSQEVMMGMGDPMIFSGYDSESMRL